MFWQPLSNEARDCRRGLITQTQVRKSIGKKFKVVIISLLRTFMTKDRSQHLKFIFDCFFLPQYCDSNLFFLLQGFIQHSKFQNGDLLVSARAPCGKIVRLLCSSWSVLERVWSFSGSMWTRWIFIAYFECLFLSAMLRRSHSQCTSFTVTCILNLQLPSLHLTLQLVQDACEVSKWVFVWLFVIMCLFDFALAEGHLICVQVTRLVCTQCGDAVASQLTRYYLVQPKWLKQ